MPHLGQGRTAGPANTAQQTTSNSSVIPSSFSCRQLQSRSSFCCMHQSRCLQAIACGCIHASRAHVSCSLPSLRGVSASSNTVRQRLSSIHWPCSLQHSNLVHRLPDPSKQRHQWPSCAANHPASTQAICRTSSSDRAGLPDCHSHPALPLSRLSSMHQLQHQLTSCRIIQTQASSSSTQAGVNLEAGSFVEDQVQLFRVLRF